MVAAAQKRLSELDHELTQERLRSTTATDALAERDAELAAALAAATAAEKEWAAERAQMASKSKTTEETVRRLQVFIRCCCALLSSYYEHRVYVDACAIVFLDLLSACTH